jgi:tRNA (mo5U34)-methyltransferase
VFRENLLRDHFQDTPLQGLTGEFIDLTTAVINQRRHGDLSKWEKIIDSLPQATPSLIRLDRDIVQIGRAEDMDHDARHRLEELMLKLHPWRKGPFSLFDIYIDSEWRSNLKWRRLQGHIRPLQDQTVLDVGSGNGYYMMRMLGEGARYVLGIDPTLLFAAQFNALMKYFPQASSTILPLRCEELPLDSIEEQQAGFDMVFSMGILYHRKHPMDHIFELKRCLKPGGQLVLETLMISGEGEEILVPEKTYAKMRNVWCIPSEAKLGNMLKQAGLKKISTIDISATTATEQRQTRWMHFESLSDFLDAEDSARTVEGYPAPRRIIVTCEKQRY